METTQEYSQYFWAKLKNMDEYTVVEYSNGYIFVPGFPTEFKEEDFDWIDDQKIERKNFRPIANSLWEILDEIAKINTNPELNFYLNRRFDYMRHTGNELVTLEEWIERKKKIKYNEENRNGTET
jgi:hypothetical protein